MSRGTTCRRNPGTKNVDISNPEPEAGTDFCAELYLAHLIQKDSGDIANIIRLPEEKGIKKEIWMYEHIRSVLAGLNQLIVALSDVCTQETNPSMKVLLGKEECVFLCSAFTPPREVSAIDYMVNTVEQATSVFTNEKYFPSRTTMKKGSSKHFVQWARRLYRIFGFAWHVHRDVFEAFEEETHLCERFHKFCEKYKLMQFHGSSPPDLIPKDYFD